MNEYADLEPCAWRTRDVWGWAFTDSCDVASSWRADHRQTEPLYAAPVAPATECPVCAKRQKFSIAVLPKITAEIISEFGEVSLIEYDKAGEAQWTQDAVDFAALVAGHLTCPIGSEFDKPIGWKFKYKESDDWSYTENAKAAKRYREREYFVQAVYDRKPAPVADGPARDGDNDREVCHQEEQAKLTPRPVPLGEWRPIEDAPKGVNVLVRFACGHIEDATIHDGGYSLFDGENLMSGNPTHWMPLPADPERSEPK